MDSGKWTGAAVAIFGGGPSLTQGVVAACEGSGLRSIAINSAVFLVPWADMLYFCDHRWYEWHREAVQAYVRAGYGHVVMLEQPNAQADRSHELPCATVLRRGPALGCAEASPFVATGGTSLVQVLNLLIHLRARLALLFGFDGREIAGRRHWHPEHAIPTPDTAMAKWHDGLRAIAPHCLSRGLTVVNCSPDSAYDCFPKRSLEEALA